MADTFDTCGHFTPVSVGGKTYPHSCCLLYNTGTSCPVRALCLVGLTESTTGDVQHLLVTRRTIVGKSTNPRFGSRPDVVKDRGSFPSTDKITPRAGFLPRMFLSRPGPTGVTRLRQ